MKPVRCVVLGAGLMGRLLAHALTVQGHQVQASPNLEILPPSDAKNKFVKVGCPLEGMMFYDDSRKKLVIKPDIFNAQPSKTERAASYVHESIYKALRDGYSVSDSRLARQITGCLFTNSPEACLNLKKVELPAKARVFKCENKEYSLSFYRTKKQENGVVVFKLLFSKINENKLGYETSTTAYSDNEIKNAADLNLQSLRFYPDQVSITGLENLGLGISCETPDISNNPMLTYGGYNWPSCQVNVRIDSNSCKVVQ